MKTTFSYVLTASLLAVAVPAFAQDSDTSTAADAVENAGQSLMDSAKESANEATNNVAESASNAVNDAAAAATDAMQNAEDAGKEDVEAAENATNEAEAATEEAPAEAGASASEESATQDATADTASETADEAASDTAAEVTATDEASPDASASEENTPAAAEAQTADAVNEEPQVGSYYIDATHNDWVVRCIKAGEGTEDPCEMYQLLRDANGNSVAEATIIPLVNGGQAVAGATLVAPLETDLVEGLTLRVDSGEARKYPFNFCAPVGCVSRIGFTQAELNSMKRGAVANVSLVPFGAAEGEVVTLDMSLSGFTAAYNALAEKVAQ